MTTATSSAARASTVSGFGALPRAGYGDLLGGLQLHFRPGTHRSALRALGDRFVVDLWGLPRLLVTCDPEDARAVLQDRDHDLSLGQSLRRLTPHPVLFGEDSLIFLEGEDHARERRRIAPPFHGELMKSYEAAMREIAERQIESWPIGQVKFMGLAQRFVLDVMRTVIFGVAGGERMRRLDRAMLRYCEIAESDGFLALGIAGVMLTGRWRGYPPLSRAAAAVDEIVLEEIAERRRSGSLTGSESGSDVLGRLLELGELDSGPKDDATIARDMRGLMLAGYETTAVSLAWMVEMLVHHPRVMQAVEASLEEGEVDYLDATITEVLRLRPAFPFTGRKVLREFDMNGLTVPSGTMVVISIMAVHERTDIYDEPLAFRPERFMQQRPGTYTWIPFGGGPHRCIGAAFATFESRVLLRELLRRRSLHPARAQEERPRRTHPMLVPEHEATVVLQPRS